jgi:molybdate transport system ATP-binding protein
MLALKQPEAISANNVLACSVKTIRTNGEEADVQLLCGKTRLVARITTSSRARLKLEPGTVVFAIVKSVTVERGAE